LLLIEAPGKEPFNRSRHFGSEPLPKSGACCHYPAKSGFYGYVYMTTMYWNDNTTTNAV